MTKIVVSQSMYFPWIGLLEQVRLADYFVHYNDVQYARGFYNRVQVKTSGGAKWITVPLRNWHRGQRIDEVQIDEREDWRGRHYDILRQSYLKAPFLGEMLGLVDKVFNKQADSLADVSRASIVVLAEYFGLGGENRFVESRALNIDGSGSQRLHDIVLALKGDIYITGHGAKNYLDHELFAREGIEVRYMQYRKLTYQQIHGEFTPYVTGLDLVANCGKAGVQFIQSDTTNWKEFIDGSN